MPRKYSDNFKIVLVDSYNNGQSVTSLVAEAFFASLKKEELHRCIYENVEELHASVKEYVHFFNADRPH